MKNVPRVFIGHQRIVSAIHRLKYLVSDKPGRHEDLPETTDPRVLMVNSLGFALPELPGGGTDLRECARRLLAMANVGRRSQILEVLVATEPEMDRSHAVATVREVARDVVGLLRAERAVIVVHGDRNHVHAHVALANDRGDGRCIEIDSQVFCQLRKGIEVWSNQTVQSAWCSGREMEHKIARMSSAELREAITQQRLEIIRDSTGRPRAIRDLRDRRRRRARIAAMDRLWPGWVDGILAPALQPQQPSQPLPVAGFPSHGPDESMSATSHQYPAALVAELRARLAALPGHRRDAPVR